MIYSDFLEAFPLLSQLKFIIGKGRTPGPMRTEDKGRVENPTLSVPSLPSMRGPLSALPSPVVTNCISGDPRNHSRLSTWVLLGAGHIDPLCQTHTKLPDSQRKTGASRALHQPNAQVSAKGQPCKWSC